VFNCALPSSSYGPWEDLKKWYEVLDKNRFVFPEGKEAADKAHIEAEERCLAHAGSTVRKFSLLFSFAK